MPKKINKKIIGYLWLTILIVGIGGYVLFPQIFNLTNLLAIIHRHYWSAIIIYILIICLRGLLFISPLSLTLASSVLFSPLTAFLINTFGILVSSILIYKFSQFLGLDEYFERKYKKEIVKIKTGLHKKEVPIIIAWSFVPIFPTDLITYISATLKISIWKCLLGIFIGTALVNAIFIYSLNFFLPTADTSPNPTIEIINEPTN
jgi:uncharacterized membrane protein YdjX (TVP38/TMEM64 family)